MITSETAGAIAGALAKAQAEFKNPEKNKEVEVRPKKRDDGYQPPNYKFKYATFDAILEMARPILAKQGVAIVQTVSNNDARVSVTTRFIHESGEWIEETLEAMPENKGLQALGSALTYLKRYSLTAMLGIAADEDDDANGADGNTVERAAPRAVQATRHTAPKATPAPTAAPEKKEVSADWRVWITSFMDEFRQQTSYLKARALWQSYASVLEGLREQEPQTYADLLNWVKAEGDLLPKDPS